MGKDPFSVLSNPKNLRFLDLVRICDRNFTIFGKKRQKSSHHIYKKPWQGDPRINIQPNRNKMAIPYQVKQVLCALEELQNRGYEIK